MTIPVVAAVLERDGRYLIGERPVNKRHGGLWEFPGGKIDEGETPQQALERELDEELRLELTGVGALLHESRDPGSDYVILFYEASASGDPEALEHRQVGWFSPQEMSTMPLAPSDEGFVRVLMERQATG